MTHSMFLLVSKKCFSLKNLVGNACALCGDLVRFRAWSMMTNCFLGVGDTEGMTKPDTINKMPKQGKNESDAHYLERVHKEVEDEMTKIQFAKEHKTRLILDQKLKSSKKVKSVKRLAERKKVKKLRAADKRRTGYEHLKDVVKFNEVVTAPPIILTKPKKVGSVTAKKIHAIDKLLQT
ncbi:hypothetical protein EG68_09694 [Paragonimus skrjabini miyazakii]|uniref:Uncharacterized protein n=1 Tax=Paragonimus skrjabini miyazakii TaxID=59628 RepID=A0A8S9YL01_9TREM|nr:hypothetical protein EG68_09694 [Paragonimus skrjabini miyazakii]